MNELQNIKKEIMDQFIQLDIDEKINFSNEIKELLHALGPFSSEPVDCVVWVKNDKVTANDYNPNSVAPPEMKLLEHSISEDGYTQPIVTYPRPEDEKIEVVDGFHRHRVGKESPLIQSRVHGYLPVVKIRSTQSDKNDRMASTIRHNRARGKHKIESMSDMVIELTRRNWSDEKIAKNLGMDSDEVLRLKQITGLAEMFSDKDFSRAWDIETSDEAGENLEKDLD